MYFLLPPNTLSLMPFMTKICTKLEWCNVLFIQIYNPYSEVAYSPSFFVTVWRERRFILYSHLTNELYTLMLVFLSLSFWKTYWMSTCSGIIRPSLPGRVLAANCRLSVWCIECPFSKTSQFSYTVILVMDGTLNARNITVKKILLLPSKDLKTYTGKQKIVEIFTQFYFPSLHGISLYLSLSDLQEQHLMDQVWMCLGFINSTRISFMLWQNSNCWFGEQDTI